MGPDPRVYGELKRSGLIVGEKGRGVFVRDMAVPLMLGLEQHMEQNTADGMIDLVFNMPSNIADTDFLRSGLKRLAKTGDLDAMLRYQPHGGRTHERKIIAKYLKPSLGMIKPKNLLVTSGGQHGLAITIFGLFNRGDIVATDSLTYAGFKSIAALHGINLVTINYLDNYTNASINFDMLEDNCRKNKLRAIYLMPNLHNPIGIVMDEATRHKITHIARRYNLLIIEDNAYGFLEANPPPSFISLIPDHTIHVDSFSKNIATGLRLGYLIAPNKYIDRLLHCH